MPRCALGGQRVGSAPPTATNRHPRAAAGCCEIDRRLKRSPRYPAIWREYPSWRVNGAEGKGVDQAWNIGRWKRLPGLVAWAIGSYDPLQVVRHLDGAWSQMKFGSAMLALLLGLQCMFLGVFLTALGARPISVSLAIVGWLIMAAGSHSALSSSRARQGRPVSSIATFGNFLYLGVRGWLVLLASVAIGGTVALAGLLLGSPRGA